MSKCRDRFIIAVPEASRSAAYVEANALTGVLSDSDNDERYDKLVLYMPESYTGTDVFVINNILTAIGDSFSFAQNVQIVNASTHVSEDLRIGVFKKTLDPQYQDRTHFIVLRKWMAPEIFNMLPVHGDSSEPQKATGNEVVATKVPGYLYEPARSTPLVLNEKESGTLNLITDAIRNRDEIYTKYDLESVLDSKSMCFLFHGPSGTGKTQAAKFLSQQLKKPLLIVDHSKLLDKYVGETEKRIAEVFKYAEDTGCLLLFDEADSLIGSRNDAEHSWEIGRINTLLQHMERSNSITIFATNYADNLDSAINRRLLFKVAFTLPDEASRVAIWKALVPKKAPKAKIDYKELGKIEVTGGEIKNAIVVAVVSAANTQAKLTTEMLAAGAKTVVSERLVDLFKEEKLKDVRKGGIGFKKPAVEQLS